MVGEFSVLMSVYDKENPEWFRSAIESIFKQTLLPNEIVLIRDGQLTEELNSVIDEFQSVNPIFRVINNDTNLGLGLSLQKGVLACSNEIIARMDTDDLMPVDRFEKEYKCILEGKYDLVSCWSLLFEDSIDNVVAIKKRPENHLDIVRYAKKRSPVSHPGSMFRRKAVIEAGNYQKVNLYEDYHLWVRMIYNGAVFYNIQESLYYVRTSVNQIGRRGGYKYMKNEISVFLYFYHIGFYSLLDFLSNILTHSIVRILPVCLRSFIFKLIWKNSV